MKMTADLFELTTEKRKGLDTRFTMEIVEWAKEKEIILSPYNYTPRTIQGFLQESDPIAYYRSNKDGYLKKCDLASGGTEYG